MAGEHQEPRFIKTCMGHSHISHHAPTFLSGRRSSMKTCRQPLMQSRRSSIPMTPRRMVKVCYQTTIAEDMDKTLPSMPSTKILEANSSELIICICWFSHIGQPKWFLSPVLCMQALERALTESNNICHPTNSSSLPNIPMAFHPKKSCPFSSPIPRLRGVSWVPRQLGGGAAAVEEISIMAEGVHLARKKFVLPMASFMVS